MTSTAGYNWPGRAARLPPIYAYLENKYGILHYNINTSGFECDNHWAYKIDARSAKDNMIIIAYYINDPEVLMECALKYTDDKTIVRPFSEYDSLKHTP